MIEIWKDIKEYENFYQISNLGNVKSLERIVCSEKWGSQKVKEKILKNCTGTGGYLKICLNKNGKTKNFDIHRLVALSFLDNELKLKCINHKDENKKNNNVSNLEWCTHKYNNEYNGRSIRVAETQRGKKREKISGRKNSRYKEFVFYETFSTTRESFKKKCIKNCVDIKEFYETYDKNTVNKNGQNIKKYFYKKKDKDVI